ncbi:heme NO-binding domain-containing protein [Flavobacterium soyangense]|uniref:Heme NO-binding domain-containing protein n=1 Tax=Flavobacterium soyangense TaxID=2023265 RepID=A0A930XTK0_9FLAO|nr:heme NO-binding domain-containing protein [Flavobacterium soyangense]MBF2707565.1 heme NO-binding domain-containing protein [Flavobacterium soyangense]
MYGIVNKAIQDLVTDNFGAEKWEEVREKSGVDVDFFLSNEPYDDDITYKLAGAAAEVLNISVGEVLNAFGEWWVLKTGKEKYGGLMEAGGNNLKEFLINLPLFHNRIMLMYPKLTPPEFKVSNIEENSIYIHYHSKREGLQEFVRGLLVGLSKMYMIDSKIELMQSRDDGNTHEIFKVSW